MRWGVLYNARGHTAVAFGAVLNRDDANGNVAQSLAIFTWGSWSAFFRDSHRNRKLDQKDQATRHGVTQLRYPIGPLHT